MSRLTARLALRQAFIPCLAFLPFLAVLAFAACTPTAAAPAAPAPRTTMHEFAFLFRTSPGLTPDQLARRAVAVRDWALALRKAGGFRSTSLFEDQGTIIAPGGALRPMATEGAVAAVLIVEAADFAAALELAKTHPGLAFGTSIEVRAVKPLPAPPPAAPPPR
jgi:hypothetical protein